MTARTDVEPRSKGQLAPGAPVRIARLFPGGRAERFVRHHGLPRPGVAHGRGGALLRRQASVIPTARLRFDRTPAVVDEVRAAMARTFTAVVGATPGAYAGAHG